MIVNYKEILDNEIERLIKINNKTEHLLEVSNNSYYIKVIRKNIETMLKIISYLVDMT